MKETVGFSGDNDTIIIVQMMVSYYESFHFVGSDHRNLLTVVIVLRMLQSVGVKLGIEVRVMETADDIGDDDTIIIVQMMVPCESSDLFYRPLQQEHTTCS